MRLCMGVKNLLRRSLDQMLSRQRYVFGCGGVGEGCASSQQYMDVRLFVEWWLVAFMHVHKACGVVIMYLFAARPMSLSGRIIFCGVISKDCLLFSTYIQKQCWCVHHSSHGLNHNHTLLSNVFRFSCSTTVTSTRLTRSPNGALRTTRSLPWRRWSIRLPMRKSVRLQRMSDLCTSVVH